jgi:uncharacterized protein
MSAYQLTAENNFESQSGCMNDKMISYFESQTCASISCLDADGNPYCFNCFYVFDAEYGSIYFKSSADTYHGQCMLMNKQVAGTILPDKLNKLALKGIQFTGRILTHDEILKERARSKYHRSYPMALAMQGEIWIIKLLSAKLTDNSLGFGKKIKWSLEEELLPESNI